MSRSLDPAMHAPGFNLAPCMPAAGLGRPADLDAYRYNRVVPMYAPDPCIGPNESQLICPPCGIEKRNDLLCPSGLPTPPSDSFQFYDTRRSTLQQKPVCTCPKFANSAPCTALGPITDPKMCPCTNRQLAQNTEQVRGVVQTRSLPKAYYGGHRAGNQPAGQIADGVGGGGCSRSDSFVGGVGPGSATCSGCGIFTGGSDGHGHAPYEYYVNNRPIDSDTVRKIPLCDVMNKFPVPHSDRRGAQAPTPHTMRMIGGHGGDVSNHVKAGRDRGGEGEGHMQGGHGIQSAKIANIGGPGNCTDYHCQNPYYSSGYLCRPVFDRKYLEDCPEQNGPHPDHYTFL